MVTPQSHMLHARPSRRGTGEGRESADREMGDALVDLTALSIPNVLHV